MATIKDVAEAAGISVGTVDRIIHKRGRYSEKTAAKVRRIMEELRYSPNMYARGLKKTRSYRFAAVLPLPEQDSGYWRLVLAGAERAAAEMDALGSRVEIRHFDRYAPGSCAGVLEELLGEAAEKPDGLLLAPVRAEEVQSVLGGASVPYVFIDTDVPGLEAKLSYIGQDSRQSGVLSGKLMALLLGMRPADKGPVLLIDPPGENYHLKERIAGFREYAEAALPGREFLRLKEESDREEEFHRSLDGFFADRPLPAGIYVANSSVYHAASWLEKRGGAWPGVPLIGYDLIPGREGFVQRGTIDFILTQQPEEQGFRGLMKLYESQVLGRRPQKEFIVPLNIITKENLRTFEQAGGESHL